MCLHQQHPCTERYVAVMAALWPHDVAHTHGVPLQHTPLVSSATDTALFPTVSAIAAGLQVISVDMEAHSVWTFEPLPCLLQLCAGGRTYLVDLLALHDHMHLLKPTFESPKILKLFHGGGADMQWLQQLEIYPVNVLDTCELAQVPRPPLLLTHLSLPCPGKPSTSRAVAVYISRPFAAYSAMAAA